ncbi:unnamed protein product [Umbelopsis ramanniana]
MVLPLLQALRLNRRPTEKKKSSKNTNTLPIHKPRFTKAPRQVPRNNSHTIPSDVVSNSPESVSKFDVFERGSDDSDEEDLPGMIVRAVRVPNSQTLNMGVLAQHEGIDADTFTPGSLLNPLQRRETYSPPHTYESKQEYLEQSEDDEEVPLAFIKFKMLRQKSAFEDLQMPSEGWSFSRRAISYDQLHYTHLPKQSSDDSGSDDDSDELYFDAAYDLQFHPQRHSIGDDQTLRHSMSAPKVTLSTIKQAKPVHVQVEEAMSAQTVHIE